MKARTIWVPAAVIVAAIATYAFVRHDGGDAVTYRFAAVERGDVESLVTSTGTLQATETVEVGTQVSGQIAELYVDFNDRVKKGQLLARIDPTILQQEVMSAEATVLRNRAEKEQAERALARNRDLFEQKVITATEFEQAQYSQTVAKASYTSAQVGLERARRNLAYTEIRAPIDGVVVERAVDVGQTVSASTSAPMLFLIAQDLTAMEILASVDESDIGRIVQGQPVRFTVQAYSAREFEGTVEQVRLQSTSQDNVVSYGVVIQLKNEDGKLLPGMTATVEFVVASAANVLKVPTAALRLQPTDEMRAALEAQRSAMTNATGGARGDAASNAARGDAAAAASGGDAAPNGARTGRRGQGGASFGMLWTIGADGTPSVVRVRTGLTDGQSTEVSGEAVTAGMQVVTGVTGGTAAAQAAPNPFQGAQQGQRTGPPRGF